MLISFSAGLCSPTVSKLRITGLLTGVLVCLIGQPTCLNPNHSVLRCTYIHRALKWVDSVSSKRDDFLTKIKESAGWSCKVKRLQSFFIVSAGQRVFYVSNKLLCLKSWYFPTFWLKSSEKRDFRGSVDCTHMASFGLMKLFLMSVLQHAVHNAAALPHVKQCLPVLVAQLLQSERIEFRWQWKEANDKKMGRSTKWQGENSQQSRQTCQTLVCRNGQ